MKSESRKPAVASMPWTNGVTVVDPHLIYSEVEG